MIPNEQELKWINILLKTKKARIKKKMLKNLLGNLMDDVI